MPRLTAAVAPNQQSLAIAEEFARLADRWREETAHLSVMWQIAMHPAYQRIIGMGRDALPLIFARLRREPDPWFWALEFITGEDPVPRLEKGDSEAEARRWLDWAKARHQLQD